MKSYEAIYWTFAILALISRFIVIGMTFYLGRKKIKKIDHLVYGSEISSGSINFKGLRLMNYSGAFAWQFGARRSKLLHIREQFDKCFQRPFIIYFWLVAIGVISIVILMILPK